MMEASEQFTVRPEVKAREVEEGQVVAVADVEEEMRGSAVVTVLEQFDQRKLEEVLVEEDRSFDIAGEERK